MLAFEEAAAVPLGGLNAIHFMRLADIAEGERVLIVDWDVHHGNGTQDIFYERDFFDIAISAKEILRLRKKANELFARETPQDIEKLEEDMHRDYWMSAQEAVDYGVAGKVIESADDLP